MADVICIQQQITRETEGEKFITHRSRRKYTACYKCPQGTWPKQGAGREGQDLGHIPLLGSMGKVHWGSRAKARLVDSNQKGQILVNSTGASI